MSETMKTFSIVTLLMQITIIIFLIVVSNNQQQILNNFPTITAAPDGASAIGIQTVPQKDTWDEYLFNGRTVDITTDADVASYKKDCDDAYTICAPYKAGITFYDDKGNPVILPLGSVNLSYFKNPYYEFYQKTSNKDNPSCAQ